MSKLKAVEGSAPQPGAAATGRLLVTIEAAPEPLRIDLSRTAVLVVDLQNDFGTRGGMFDRAGIDLQPIQRVVEPTAAVLAAARAAGIPIVYLKMEFQPDLSDLGPADSPNALRHRMMSVGDTVPTPTGQQGRILVKGTWNTEIIDELRPKPQDVIVSKHRFSGFYDTELDAELKARGIKYIAVTGCTTSVCVESTVRDAMFRDYSCLVLSDCTAEVIGSGLARSNHQASLLVIETMLGWVTTSTQLIEGLRAAEEKESERTAT